MNLGILNIYEQPILGILFLFHIVDVEEIAENGRKGTYMARISHHAHRSLELAHVAHLSTDFNKTNK